MKWNTISMGDIALRKGGSVDPKKHQDEVFELYSVPAFDAGAPEVVAGSAIGSPKKAIRPNDVMISRIVPHIRRACVVGLANGHRQIASGEWIIFRDERIWPKYLRWVLVGDVFHSAFMRTVSGVGGSLLRARPAEVFKIQIPLPPLAEQKRIAGILDAADALRAKRRQALGQLDTLLQSTFIDMFGDPVTNPMGWDAPPLADCCKTGTGGTPSRAKMQRYYEGGTIPWVKSGELREEVITSAGEHVTATALKETNLKLIPKDAVLIALYGATVGRLGILGIQATTNQAVCHIIPNSLRVDLRYLFHTLLNQVSYLVGRGVGGAQPNISQGILKSLPIPLPPLDLQHRFAAIVGAVAQQKANQRAHLAELDTLFACLQSRAFRGDL